MAIGDDAVAAGIPIMTGSELANTLDTEVNKTRDEIARRTNAVTPVAKGGTGANAASGARANLSVPEVGTAGGKAVMDVDGSGALGFRWNGRRFSGRNGSTEAELAHLADVFAVEGTANSAAATANSAAATAGAAKGGYLDPAVYARVIGGSYRVCYVAADGTLGWVSSSRRFKKNIHPAVVDPQAVLALELVTFLYKVEIDTEGITQWGLIAEQLDELGLDWLVDYSPDGQQPEGVRYDRFALALLPVMQHLAAQLAHEREERERLADRVAAIETHLDALGGASL